MLKCLGHLADRTRDEGTIRYLFSQLGERMNRHGLAGLGISIGLFFAVSCGQKAPTDTVQRGNTTNAATGSNTGNSNTTPATNDGTNKGTVVLPSQQVAKSK